MSSQPRIAETAMGFWKEFSRMSREGVVYPGRGILYPVLRIVGTRVFIRKRPTPSFGGLRMGELRSFLRRSMRLWR